MEQQYEYFAIVTDARPSLENPTSMFRRWVDESGQVHREESPDGQRYTYVAWVDDKTLDDPDGVLRTWTKPNGYNKEQRYIPGSGWRDSYIREDWHRGRYDGDFEVIDQAVAQRIIQTWEQRRTEQG